MLHIISNYHPTDYVCIIEKEPSPLARYAHSTLTKWSNLASLIKGPTEIVCFLIE